MQQRTPGPVLSRLQSLVGEWELAASIDGQPTARGRTSFEWLEKGAFLVQHADAGPPPPGAAPEWSANSPFPPTTILGLDDATGVFSMLYADARGVCRVYRMRLATASGRSGGRRAPPSFSASRPAQATTPARSRVAGNAPATGPAGNLTSTCQYTKGDLRSV